MPSSLTNTVFVARQPIFDSAGRVFGYEVLYRRAISDKAAGAVALDQANARLVLDSVLGVGLETLTHGLPAFINLEPRLITDDIGTLLSPTATIIAIDADAPLDPDVMVACQRLHAAGYRIAFDNVISSATLGPALDFATFVRVDVQTTSDEERQQLAADLLPSKVRLIATQVETVPIAFSVRAAGYELCQGSFFAQPSTSRAEAIPPSMAAQLQLLAALNRSDLTIGELEDLIKHDVGLSVRVLRCINSAGTGMRQEVHSIRQALVMLGMAPLRKWASVWALAGLNRGTPPEGVVTALIRAHACERFGDALYGKDAGSEFFLLGLCSLLDAMLAQPMAEVVAGLPLSGAVSTALLGEPNVPRWVLDAVISYEHGAWNPAIAAAQRAGLSGSTLHEGYSQALARANSLVQVGMTA